MNIFSERSGGGEVVITPPVSVADLDDEAYGGKPCPDCGCLPGEQAEGSDGDGVWFQAWACVCGCHYPAWMED